MLFSRTLLLSLIASLASTTAVANNKDDSSIASSSLTSSAHSSSKEVSSSFSSAESTSSDADSPFPTVEIYSSDAYVWYLDVNLGTPEQMQGLRIDISQPYLWFINSSAFPVCPATTTSYSSSSSFSSSSSSSLDSSTPAYTNECERYGAYDLSDSSSGYSYNDTYAQYVFIDYVYMNGSIKHDVMSFLNGSINNLDVDFMLANESNVEVGALGLGSPIASDDSGYQYHILDLLVDNGYINSSAYSLVSVTNTTGLLIFGGVDTDHYVDPLVQFANIPYQYRDDDLRYNYPIVPLSSITVMNDKGSTVMVLDSAIPVLLDSRTSYNYLPYSTVVSLSVQLNAFYSSDSGIWFLKCSVRDIDAVISFHFGNLTIDVSVDRFISNLTTDTGGSVTFEDGTEACALRVLPNTYYGYSVLGMSVIQDMYMAVDVDGNNIALAQANNESYKSKLEKVDNTTSTSSTKYPYASSEIQPGTIPFASSNNVTESLVFSYSYTAFTDSALVGMTAVYTSGVVFTGRVMNATTSTTSTNSTSSSKGLGNRVEVYGTDGLVMGVFGTLLCLVLGLVL